MIDPSVLQVLRCPLDPKRQASLTLEEHRVFCSRCRVRFPTRDGIINFVVGEAILPDRCRKVDQLPCQVEQREGV